MGRAVTEPIASNAGFFQHLQKALWTDNTIYGRSLCGHANLILSKNRYTSAMKPLRFVGSAYDELCAFPREAYRSIGRALMIAQPGAMPPNAKPLRGFGGASVLEVLEDYQGDAYRAAYTVKLASAVYVLHCFQKKSPRGSQVPKLNRELIEKRWRDALRIEKENAE